MASWPRHVSPAIDDWYDRTEAHRSSPIREWPDALRHELEDSWQSVVTTPERSAGRYLQAVTADLRAEDVVGAWVVS